VRCQIRAGTFAQRYDPSSACSPPLHRPDADCNYLVLGTEYGGWPILRDTLGTKSIVYSFGVGENISFDSALIERFGCSVWAFDPTPKARDWIAKQALPGTLQFSSIGIAVIDGGMTFYPPANTNYVSYSAAAGPDQFREPIIAPVARLSSLMTERGHNFLDLLKMDVEGFEYEVVQDLLTGDIPPRQLLVEFHHGMYGIVRCRTIEAVAALCDASYAFFYISPTGHEYGFFAEGLS
jgi:FkbM family methyltransferase